MQIGRIYKHNLSGKCTEVNFMLALTEQSCVYAPSTSTEEDDYHSFKMLLRSSILKTTDAQWQWFLVLILTCLLILKDGHVVSGQEKYGSYVTLQTRLGHLLGTVEQIHINKLQWPPSGNDVASPSNNISQYYSFKGIRFAEPVQRFQDSVVKRPSSGFVNATVPGSPCAQFKARVKPPELIGSEDCLFADVYIPVRKRNPNELFKIMVFFHGGGFLRNFHINLVPTPLLLHENAIIVGFNARVSVLGYLSTGTSDLPGNYGALDHITLLKWVQIYARDFGGDPNHVTIFGDTTAAAMVHYVLLSKLASGLFHRSIFVSGSAYCERFFTPNPLDIAIKVGLQLGCQNHNPAQLVACIRSFSTAEIMATEHGLLATSDNPLNNFIRNRLMSEMMTTIWTDFANDIEPEVTTTGPLFTNWLKWEPVCKAYNYTDPDYPLYEISLNNHRIYKNYRIRELDFWWNIHLDTFRSVK